MDDQMRMQAVVVDGFTGPLKKLNESLKAAGSVKTGADMRKDWEGVRKEIGSATRELNTVFAPALRGIGVASLGIGAGVTGMLIGLKDTATYGRNLKFLSDQLRISADKLREIEAIGQHFDIPIGQTESALKGFADNMNQLVRNWGAAYNTLRGMNLGWLADDLKKALAHGGLGEAFDKALEDLKKIPDPVYRRQIAQLLLGSDQWSTVATEMTKGTLAGIMKDVGKLDPDFEKKSERFVDDLKHIERQLQTMKIEFFGPLLPGVSTMLEDLDAAAKAIGRDFEMIKNHDWKGLMAPDPIDQKRMLKRQLDAAQYKLKGVDSDISAFGARGDKPAVDDLQTERHQLVDEITKLRKELEDLNKNQLLHKQSFVGGGVGMPSIIPAMYSGGGAGGIGGLNDHLRRNLSPAPDSHATPSIGDRSGGTGGLNGNRATWMSFAMRSREQGGLGLSREQAAGVVGNLMAESGAGIKPWGPTGDGGTAWGSAQWRGDRLHNLMRMFPDSYKTVESQQKFMRWEMDHGYGRAYDAIRRASSPEEAAARMDQYYERSSGGARRQRQSYARRLFDQSRHQSEMATPLPLPAPPQIRGGEAQRVEGHATLHVQLDGLPSSAKTRFAYGGMFREVRLTRTNRQAALADDYVS